MMLLLTLLCAIFYFGNAMENFLQQLNENNVGQLKAANQHNQLMGPNYVQPLTNYHYNKQLNTHQRAHQTLNYQFTEPINDHNIQKMTADNHGDQFWPQYNQSLGSSSSFGFNAHYPVGGTQLVKDRRHNEFQHRLSNPNPASYTHQQLVEEPSSNEHANEHHQYDNLQQPLINQNPIAYPQLIKEQSLPNHYGNEQQHDILQQHLISQPPPISYTQLLAEDSQPNNYDHATTNTVSVINSTQNYLPTYHGDYHSTVRSLSNGLIADDFHYGIADSLPFTPGIDQINRINNNNAKFTTVPLKNDHPIPQLDVGYYDHSNTLSTFKPEPNQKNAIDNHGNNPAAKKVPDNDDILNQMDSIHLSHIRLLTEGVVSANGHEYVLQPKDYSSDSVYYNTSRMGDTVLPNGAQTRKIIAQKKALFIEQYPNFMKQKLKRKKIAEIIGVTPHTILAWKKKFFFQRQH